MQMDNMDNKQQFMHTPQYPVILCGFMGCGKTTIGKRIAKLSNLKFIDMDDYIVDKAGMPITEIFEKYGENYFRDLEHNACKDIAKMKGVIIAAGGGALTFERNIKALKEHNGRIIFIEVPLNEIAKRLRGDKSRPMLNRKDKDKAMKELYEKRYPLYKAAADYIIDGCDEPDKVAQVILKFINITDKVM